MAFHRRVRAGLAAVLAGALLGACGGGGGNDDARSPGGGVVVGAPLASSVVCPGVDLASFDQRVFVSADGADAPACGAVPGNPCKSPQTAITSCDPNTHCAIVMRQGLYTTQEPLRIVERIDVYGGCRYVDDDDLGLRTVLQRVSRGSTDTAPAVQAENIRKDTTIQNIVVLAPDQTGPGVASIALQAQNSPGLKLVGTTLVAGQGGPGADGGTPAVSSGQSGQEGRNGAGSGGAACSRNDSVGQGGRGGSRLQAAYYGIGCYVGTCSCAYPNGDDSVGRVGSPSGQVSGGGNGGGRASAGAWCIGAASQDDFRGKSGQSGGAGGCATRGGMNDTVVLIGSFENGQWRAGSQPAGYPGDVGSGGGGGNSGGFCFQVNTGGALGLDGGAGGGGGGGGCGGAGGEGGGNGGASIALVMLGSAIQRDATQNVVVPGSGGVGGRGGPGGTGGTGGSGGAGDPGGWYGVIANDWSCPGPGGRGGNGGQGGAGSGGPGGTGGPSIGIAVADGAPKPASGQGIYPYFWGPNQYGSRNGDGGPGGQNGSGQCSGAQGGTGLIGGGSDIWAY